MKNINNITGAQACIESLLAEGVDLIFGYPGGAIMPVYDALMNYHDKLKHVLVRHEQGAIHEAQGYARVSGKVGVCMATSGPGATNLITGLADAMIDSTPLVCITGQVNRTLLGSDAFQETDVISLSIPVTKWNYQITDANEIAEVFAKAFHIAASGRPGPVLIDITKNAQFDKLNFSYRKCSSLRYYHPKPDLNLALVEKSFELLKLAKRPMVLAGQGIVLSGAEEDLLKFSEKFNLPVACTLLGLSAFPKQHKNYAGLLGMHGNYGPNKLTNECDLLIALGMRFDDRVTGDLSKYAKQAKVVHVDIDHSELNKNVKADLAIHACVNDYLKQMNLKSFSVSESEWLNRFHELNSFETETLNKIHTKGINMKEAVLALNNALDENSVLVTDVGQHQMAVARYFHFKGKRSQLTSGGLGTMGFALPAAIGAKFGAPNKDVVAVIGDGGFQMTLQELGTIMQENLNVKIVLFNNSFLGMVRQWQELFFDKRYSFTELHNPDFGKLASAYNIAYDRIESKNDLQKSFHEMMNHKGPYLLEVKIEKEENVFPMVPTGKSVSEMILCAEEN